MSQARAGEPGSATIVRAEDELADAVGLLRRAVATIDRLWSGARTAPSGTTLTLALGEASQGVHRALMALAEQAPGVEPSDLVRGTASRHG